MEKLLDHGYLKVVDHWGSDERIIEAARMSTSGGFKGWGTPESPGDERLLSYLWKNKHATPFEMAGIMIEVQAPVFVFREWHRHRTQSYNELSARYTKMPNLHYIPHPSRVKKQSKKNKQATSDESLPDNVVSEFLQEVEMHQRMIYEAYEKYIKAGISREIARINTPVSRYSRMRASANLRNWLAFMTLRCDKAAQYEIRVYANALAQVIKMHFPKTYMLWTEDL